MPLWIFGECPPVILLLPCSILLHICLGEGAKFIPENESIWGVHSLLSQEVLLIIIFDIYIDLFTSISFSKCSPFYLLPMLFSFILKSVVVLYFSRCQKLQESANIAAGKSAINTQGTLSLSAELQKRSFCYYLSQSLTVMSKRWSYY